MPNGSPLAALSNDKASKFISTLRATLYSLPSTHHGRHKPKSLNGHCRTKTHPIPVIQTPSGSPLAALSNDKASKFISTLRATLYSLPSTHHGRHKPKSLNGHCRTKTHPIPVIQTPIGSPLAALSNDKASKFISTLRATLYPLPSTHHRRHKPKSLNGHCRTKTHPIPVIQTPIGSPLAALSNDKASKFISTLRATLYPLPSTHHGRHKPKSSNGHCRTKTQPIPVIQMLIGSYF
jgi:hypothetical protein